MGIFNFIKKIGDYISVGSDNMNNEFVFDASQNNEFTDKNDFDDEFFSKTYQYHFLKIFYIKICLYQYLVYYYYNSVLVWVPI